VMLQPATRWAAGGGGGAAAVVRPEGIPVGDGPGGGSAGAACGALSAGEALGRTAGYGAGDAEPGEGRPSVEHQIRNLFLLGALGSGDLESSRWSASPLELATTLPGGCPRGGTGSLRHDCTCCSRSLSKYLLEYPMCGTLHLGDCPSANCASGTGAALVAAQASAAPS
jgi:hypothetical protein